MHAQPRGQAPISERHPLRHMFRTLTEASFEQVGMPDRDLMTYVTGLLIDFIHVDNLYRVRDAKGRRLEYLFDMQLESRRGDATHARETQKHLGDYALFIVGLYPESLRRRRRAVSPEYYVSQGKQAYTTVSEMDSPAPSAVLFRKLAAHFETCVGALHVEKDFLSDTFYQYLIRQMVV